MFNEVKKEKPLNDIETFFIHDNDIFNGDDISEANRRFIMDLVDGTSFIADAKKFVEDTKTSQAQVFIDNNKKREGVHSQNRLMKKVKVKNEFLNEKEKNRKRAKKTYRERVKSR